MKNLIKVNFLKRKAPASLLGLSLDGSRLESVLLKRHNGSLQIVKRVSAALTLDPLTADQELAGREILNHLEAAGVRERQCVVALPVKWALTAHTEIPNLPESDIPGFLQIEAERGFPTDVASLQVASSHARSATGKRHATFVGIPVNHVERLLEVLRSARLRPLSVSLGITALLPADAPDADGVMALAVESGQVELQVTAGGGLVALRALEGAVEPGSPERVVNPEWVAREARITLGQLPDDLRGAVKRIRLFGPREQVDNLADAMRSRFEAAGLKIETMADYPRGHFGRTLPDGTLISSALSVAARQLTGRNDPFEFLPPRVSAWQRLTSRYAPGKLRKVAALALILVVGVVGAFAFQQWRLSRLESKWRAMETEVRELETISGQISQYRPWFDTSFRCLSILKQLTMAFPEDGSVTARTVEIRDMSSVTCSGNAESYAALIRTVHLLGTNAGVGDLVPQTRGKSPIQFSFEYRVTGPVNENR